MFSFGANSNVLLITRINSNNYISDNVIFFLFLFSSTLNNVIFSQYFSGARITLSPIGVMLFTLLHFEHKAHKLLSSSFRPTSYAIHYKTFRRLFPLVEPPLVAIAPSICNGRPLQTFSNPTQLRFCWLKFHHFYSFFRINCNY